VPDGDFDVWLPEEAQVHSRRFWTPVGVALRVTRWLSEVGASSVLDVGSGAGKFCVVGALGSALRFVGIEHRAHLVDASRALASQFEVQNRVEFVHGT
jgi:predicted RNA methylase